MMEQTETAGMAEAFLTYANAVAELDGLTDKVSGMGLREFCSVLAEGTAGKDSEPGKEREYDMMLYSGLEKRGMYTELEKFRISTAGEYFDALDAGLAKRYGHLGNILRRTEIAMERALEAMARKEWPGLAEGLAEGFAPALLANNRYIVYAYTGTYVCDGEIRVYIQNYASEPLDVFSCRETPDARLAVRLAAGIAADKSRLNAVFGTREYQRGADLAWEEKAWQEARQKAR